MINTHFFWLLLMYTNAKLQCLPAVLCRMDMLTPSNEVSITCSIDYREGILSVAKRMLSSKLS